MFEAVEALIKPIMMLLSFVSGGNSFPKPLTAKEEKEYLTRLSEGDNEAREKLIHDLMDFAKQSGDGGEYFISVNGMRMWLSYKEINSLLFTLLVEYAHKTKEYEFNKPTGMVID